MLPRWTDAARLWLAPGQVILALSHRGLRPRRAVVRSACEPGIDPLLAAASGALATLPARTPVRVTLSDHLVRYVLVPFNPLVVGPGPLGTVARQAFRRIHGATVDGWSLSVSAVGQRTRVAAAVDTPLQQGLVEAARAAGVALEAIEPLLMDGFNRARSHLRATGWFAVAEPGRVTLVRTAGGDWARIVSARCEEDWRAALEQLASRDAPWIEPGHDTFCQVTQYRFDADDAVLAPVARVISLADVPHREAA